VERYASFEERVGDVLERVSIFRAVFDNADRMSGIFVATSKDDQNYKARHSNKKEQDKEQDKEEKQEKGETQEKQEKEERQEKETEEKT
jgi:hypothetical protein